MFKLLIVAATVPEAAFLSKNVKNARKGNLITLEKSITFEMDLLITGIGITATTFHLTKALSGKNYDLAINVGICGSLDPVIVPVRVVNITEDRFADFGIEDGTIYRDVFEAGLKHKNEKPYANGLLKSDNKLKPESLKAIPAVKAITVQLVHGTNASAQKAFRRYGPVMESMEGAAFFYACRMENIPCLQIRAVSNKVEKRNKKKWKITKALDALAGFMGLLLLEIHSKYS